MITNVFDIPSFRTHRKWSWNVRMDIREVSKKCVTSASVYSCILKDFRVSQIILYIRRILTTVYKKYWYYEACEWWIETFVSKWILQNRWSVNLLLWMGRKNLICISKIKGWNTVMELFLVTALTLFELSLKPEI